MAVHDWFSRVSRGSVVSSADNAQRLKSQKDAESEILHLILNSAKI